MTSNYFLTHTAFEDPFVNSQEAQLSRSPLSPNNTLPVMQDGLSPPKADHYFINGTTSNLNMGGEAGQFNPAFSTPQSQMEWSQLHLLDYQYPVGNSYFDISTTNGEGIQDLCHRGIDNDTTYPPTWPQSYGPRIGVPLDVEAAMSDGYMLDSFMERCHDPITGGHAMDYLAHDNSRELASLSLSGSPTMQSHPSSTSPAAFERAPVLTELPSPKASEDGETEIGEGNLSTCEERISDEPYAKLIHRALLGAPNHSMVLQEIYQWFIDNTDKGNSASLGWRNSIRHNLSMNAAFRKTDRMPPRDDMKKTSQWVLEPWAVKNGVTPTTRYRKTSKKTIRSEDPAPARVRSGRAGGLSARKTKSREQKSQAESREIVGVSQNKNRRGQSQARHSMTSATTYQHLSPSTPISYELSTPGPCHSKTSFFGDPISFGDVQGVYMEEGSIFCADEHEGWVDKQQHLWPEFRG